MTRCRPWSARCSTAASTTFTWYAPGVVVYAAINDYAERGALFLGFYEPDYDKLDALMGELEKGVVPLQQTVAAMPPDLFVEPYDFKRGYLWNEMGSMEFHFDDAHAIKKLVSRYSPEDIAAEAQRVLEAQVMEVVFRWLEKEGTRTLCAAGGVFLNVKLNQRLWYSNGIDSQWTYPNCGDSGLAYGAAVLAYHSINITGQGHRLRHVDSGDG